MKVLVVLFAFVAMAAAGAAGSLENPDFPGQCYLEEYKTAVKPGDVFSVPGKCMDLRCAEDLKSIFGTGCGTFAVAPPCTISDTDYSKPFPECCPQAVCPKE